jgi:hypothetical protein
MSNIVVANEYTSVHTKGWLVPKKKQQPGAKRQVKGHVKVRRDLTTERLMPLPVSEFDTAEEMVKGVRQGTEKMLDRFRYPDQQSLTQVEKRYTNGMWSNELAKRILKENSNLFVEDSINVPGCAGFYKMVGKEKVAAGSPNASFRHGYMPEASIIKENQERLATEFIYGWRQVLIRLRRSGDLSQAQFGRLWGVVDTSDERARHWASDLAD